MTVLENKAQDRTVAALVHLSIFLNFVVFLSGVIVALVVALLYRDKSAFVARHAFQSFVFQVGMGLIGAAVVAFAVALWVGAVLTWMPATFAPPGAPAPLPWAVGLFVWAVVMGLMLLGAALLVLAIVLPVAGAVRAHRGEAFDYPVVGRLVPSWWYSSGG